jgi:hypothetical protein
MTLFCKRHQQSWPQGTEVKFGPRDEYGITMLPCCLTDQIGGDTFDPALDGKRLGKQMLRVLNAMQSNQWLTLAEIKQITTDPEASISARLRDVRKRWGEGAMESRRRASAGLESGLWEFRVNLPEGTEL